MGKWQNRHDLFRFPDASLKLHRTGLNYYAYLTNILFYKLVSQNRYRRVHQGLFKIMLTLTCHTATENDVGSAVQTRKIRCFYRMHDS